MQQPHKLETTARPALQRGASLNCSVSYWLLGAPPEGEGAAPGATSGTDEFPVDGLVPMLEPPVLGDELMPEDTLPGEGSFLRSLADNCATTILLLSSKVA